MDITDAIVFIANEEGRDGSEYDVLQMEKTCKLLNFQSVVWRGTCKDHQNEMVKLKDSAYWRQRFTEVNAIFVICMRHGDRVSTIRKNYINMLAKMEELNRKLKVLIAQCCQGNATTFRYRQTDGDDKADPRYLICWFAASDGNTAPRDVNNGTPFIQSVCRALVNGAKERKHLMQIIKEFRVQLKDNTMEAAEPKYRLSYPDDEIEFYLPQIENCDMMDGNVNNNNDNDPSKNHQI